MKLFNRRAFIMTILFLTVVLIAASCSKKSENKDFENNSKNTVNVQETGKESESDKETEVVSGSGEETEILSSSGEETEAISASGEETEVISASGEETEVISASGEETEVTSSSGEEIEAISGSGEETEAISASGEETEVISSSGEETEAISASGEETEVISASGEETQETAVPTEEAKKENKKDNGKKGKLDPQKDDESGPQETVIKESYDSVGKGISDTTIKKTLKKLATSTDIPTVCVYTEDSKEVVSRTEYVNCKVYTINCDKEYLLSGDEAGIRVRGNSTAYGGNVNMIRKNQVPYRIKFTTKTNMFGLNSGAKCKNWVLVKAEADLLKTEIALRLGRIIVRDYCSDGLLVHAYLNGEYKGIYELCEQNQVNKHRINIYETPEGYKETDTGYLVEIDNYGEKPNFWLDYCGRATTTDMNGTKKSFKAVCYSIKSDVYSEEQKSFIKKYVTNTFKVLYEACEKGNYYILDEENNLKKAGKKVLNKKDENDEVIDPAQIVAERVLNIDSVVDMYILHEIVKSCDVGEGSFYMYADFSPESSDSRLTFTCPWDFEWAYVGSAQEYHAALFNTEAFASTYEERSNPWFIILMKQDWFVEKVKERWTELRQKPGKNVKNPISTAMDEIKVILETYKKDLSKSGSNAINRANSLISWTYKRLSFMDQEFYEKK